MVDTKREPYLEFDDVRTGRWFFTLTYWISFVWMWNSSSKLVSVITFLLALCSLFLVASLGHDELETREWKTLQDGPPYAVYVIVRWAATATAVFLFVAFWQTIAKAEYLFYLSGYILCLVGVTILHNEEMKARGWR